MGHALRRSGRQWLILALAAAVWVACRPAPVEAKSFVFSRVAIEATVAPDGSMKIVESRTYRFDGEFSWATYRLPLTGAGRVVDIRVADERGPYTRASVARPGTYEVRREGDAVEIRWGFVAADQSRTFTIAYVLDDVVVVHDDVAEVYWKFVGDGWDRPSQDVTITVRLPGRLSASQIRAWGHGPLHGDVRPTDGGAELAVRDLGPRTMVEGRIVFPRDVVPHARVRRSGTALPRILHEEGAWAAAANRARVLTRLTVAATGVLPVVVLGLWLFLYLRYGREHVPAFPEGYYRELPGLYAPAELGALWRFGSVQPADFVATVLDLARKGYLSVETLQGDRDGTYTLTRTTQKAGLVSFEADALAVLFGSQERPAQSVTIARRGGLPPDVRRRVGQRFAMWARAVSQSSARLGFFDTTSMRMSTAAQALGALLIFGAFYVGSQVGIAQGIAVAMSGAVLLAGSGALRRRSQRGADDLRRWKGFRRFLLDFSEMPRAELPSLAIWEQYLVYAVPLGVADRVIEQLGKIYPAEELAHSTGLRAWVGGSGGHHGDRPLASLGAFTTALAAATSSASSGSGRGGGFSGGGGGGGGGSGGSAG